MLLFLKQDSHKQGSAGFYEEGESLSNAVRVSDYIENAHSGSRIYFLSRKAVKLFCILMVKAHRQQNIRTSNLS